MLGLTTVLGWSFGAGQRISPRPASRADPLAITGDAFGVEITSGFALFCAVWSGPLSVAWLGAFMMGAYGLMRGHIAAHRDLTRR